MGKKRTPRTRQRSRQRSRDKDPKKKMICSKQMFMIVALCATSASAVCVCKGTCIDFEATTPVPGVGDCGVENCGSPSDWGLTGTVWGKIKGHAKGWVLWEHRI